MKKILPFIILTIVSSFLIFYRFADIPKYLAFDEVEFTKLALSLENKPYITYSTLATGHSTLYFYILLASLKAFGINIFALRFPAAVFGILSVIMFYLVIQLSLRGDEVDEAISLRFRLLRFARNDILPIFLTLIFLSSRWFLNFSRFSFEATFLLFLELTSIYFLIKSNVILGRRVATTPESLLDSGRAPSSLARMTYIVMSGLFAGLAFLSYTPGRIFFILPLFFLIFQRIGQVQDLPLHKTTQQFNNVTIKQFLLFLIPFLIITAPLTSYLMTNKDTRVDQQFFLKNHEMPITEKISGLWHNIASTALMFNIKGDVNGRHNYPNKPALNPILGILFITGIIISIKNFNNLYNKLFLFYFLISLFPALMTYPWENPNMLRTYTVLPSVVFFIGQNLLVIERSKTMQQFLKLLRLPRSLWSLAMTIIIVLLILFSCLYELRTYFKYQSIVFDQSFEIKLPLDRAIRIKLKP